MVTLVDLDPWLDEACMEPSKDLRHVPLRDDEHKTHIGTSLKPDDNILVSETLIDNADLFSMTVVDMLGVSLNIIITHRLSIYKEVRLVAQKKRKMGEEKRDVAREKTKKLMKVGFIRKAHYTTWLVNVVMVKKSNGKWRMYVDCTDLNKASRKDFYFLSSIERFVDGAGGHTILSFLNAYSGYNQIQMHPRDKEKTSFMTDCNNFYYEFVRFSLKNAGAIYQRLMIFKDMLSRSVEFYVHDIVVKSDSCQQYIKDLQEVFQTLHNHGMRLNPDKYASG